MPSLTITEQSLLHVANGTVETLQVLASQNGRYPFPLRAMMRQIVSDRLNLAGENMRAGDSLLLDGKFRASIGRYYYAMYHAARAVTYAETQGDDHQQHSQLPRNLPANLTDVAALAPMLVDARLLRNQADYDPYPITSVDWEADARKLAGTAAAFLKACEDFALLKGHI